MLFLDADSIRRLPLEMIPKQQKNTAGASLSLSIAIDSVGALSILHGGVVVLAPLSTSCHGSVEMKHWCARPLIRCKVAAYSTTTKTTFSNGGLFLDVAKSASKNDFAK